MEIEEVVSGEDKALEFFAGLKFEDRVCMRSECLILTLIQTNKVAQSSLAYKQSCKILLDMFEYLRKVLLYIPRPLPRVLLFDNIPLC